MTSNSTIPPDAILNPYTPMAFLPPDVADQYQVMCYVYVATFAAFTWDWLMSIPEEYQMIRKQGFGLPSVVYFVSRSGTFGSSFATVIYKIMSTDNCASLKYVEGICFAVGGSATSLLFVLRVRAVYNRSRTIVVFFGIFWLCIAGSWTLILLGITGSHVPYTRRCIEALHHTYTSIPVVLTAVNDTLVFLAISYRILSSPMVSCTWSARARSFFTGEGLHQLSKALLQSGQVYYFATIGVAIIATAFILSPNIPAEYHYILATANYTLACAMACRVFRAVVLGTITDTQMNTATLVSFYRSAADTRRNSNDKPGQVVKPDQVVFRN